MTLVTEAEEAGGAGRISTSRRAYSMLRERLLRFAIRPNQRINEVVLASELEVSRTPLREALNRLVAEGLLEHNGRGFSAPDLEPEGVGQLFEARIEIECSIVRLACERASKEGLDALEAFLEKSAAESPDASVDLLMEFDRGFHDGLAALTGNDVLAGLLSNLNDRVHLMRWIAMEGRRGETQGQHRAILARIRAGDPDGAIELMRQHIMHRNADILAAIKAAYGHIYTCQMQPDGKP